MYIHESKAKNSCIPRVKIASRGGLSGERVVKYTGFLYAKGARELNALNTIVKKPKRIKRV